MWTIGSIAVVVGLLMLLALIARGSTEANTGSFFDAGAVRDRGTSAGLKLLSIEFQDGRVVEIVVASVTDAVTEDARAYVLPGRVFIRLDSNGEAAVVQPHGTALCLPEHLDAIKAYFTKNPRKVENATSR